MFKVWQLVYVVAAVWISAAVSEDCLFQYELWPDTDPTKFNYCNPSTNQAEVADCEPNRGFVKNETVTGCVPWLEWSDTCVNKVDVATITCEGDTFMQPHGVVNPQTFYLCLAQNTAPVALECPQGRGFYAKNNYLGCFPWEMWRTLTGCNDAGTGASKMY